MKTSVTVNLDAYIGARFVENLLMTGTASIDAKGNALDNFLTGNSGDNRLSGGLGSDTMTGGAGADEFVYDGAFEVGIVDRVSDFVAGEDRIGLDDAVFTVLGLGTLAANAFVANDTGCCIDDRPADHLRNRHWPTVL